MNESETLGAPTAIPFSTSAAFNKMRLSASKLADGFIKSFGMCGMMSTSASEIVRSTCGLSASATAGGRSRDFVACCVRPTATTRCADGAATTVPLPLLCAAISNGSLGASVRVAFGITVLLRRSPLGFSRGGSATTTAEFFSARLPMRSRAFLNNPANGIAIALMILRRHPPDFLERRQAFERLVDACHAQSLHAFGNPLILDHRGRRALDD